MFAEVVVPRWMPRAAGWDGGTGGDAKDWLGVKGLNPGEDWGNTAGGCCWVYVG